MVRFRYLNPDTSESTSYAVSDYIYADLFLVSDGVENTLAA